MGSQRRRGKGADGFPGNAVSNAKVLTIKVSLLAVSYSIEVPNVNRAYAKPRTHPQAPKIVCDQSEDVIVGEAVGGPNLRESPVLETAQTQPRSSRAELLFKFALPAFDSANHSGFRYKLDGLENPGDAWHEVQRGREARYQSVPPGTYRFRVQRLGSTSVANNTALETSFSLVLPRPWHATMIFRLFAGAMIVFALAATHRRRLDRIQKMHAAVLTERSRIARDVHDSLEQDLSGLRLQIEAAALTMNANPVRSQEHLTRAAELITDGVVDLRNSIWGLRGSNVSTSELVIAIRSRLDRITAGTRLNVTVHAKGEPRVLSAAVATHVVHVAREGVTNAIKHATAKAITVSIDTTAIKEMTLLVSDDGGGIVASSPKETSQRLAGGQGLPSMQVRAKSIGGRLEIDSSPGQGTRIRLYVPTRVKRRSSE